MADIALSSGVRTNLQSLQNIANLLTTSQERLSTGKKVNSALDNPASFFTARGFSDRAESLNGLLDGMSTGIQTIKAANTGLDTISKLLKQATSVAQQFKANGGYTAQGRRRWHAHRPDRRR
jgi:flagellin-like hook-associated protein FlgL